MNSLRRLLASHLLVTLLLTLIGVSGGVYWMVSRHLYRGYDLRLLAAVGRRPVAPPLPSAAHYADQQTSVRVYDAEGRVVGQAGGPAADPPRARPDILQELRRSGRPWRPYASHNRHENWRMLLVKVSDLDGHWAGALEIGVGTRPAQDLLRALGGYLLLCTSLGMALGGLACGLLARKVGRPVEDLAETARSIAAGDWQARADELAGPMETRSLARDFNAMVARLRESFETQRRFVADASHELKTPLTSLGAMAEILEGHEMDEDTKKRALAVIGREVDRMEQLVSDLLTLSRLEHSEKDPEPLELSVPLVDLLEEYRLRRSRLEWQVAPEVRVRISPGHWQRLVRNLLDNAIHYTPEEKAIQLRLEANGTLVVADQGQGIAEKDLPHLFRRFYRADLSRARESGGTGLGLSIVEGIVQQAGGEIQLASVLGEGTTVTVKLPCR